MVQSKILSKYTNLLHYFGDKNSKQLLVCEASTNLVCTVSVEQIHGNKVVVLKNDRNKVIKNADGMITNKPLILAIRTADCLPIFFYDHKNKIIAALHAGWKGLAKRIVENAIKAMKKLGGNVSDFVVAIGPHIKICCYNVPRDRLDKFQITNANGRLYLLRDDKWYLNLSEIALMQLKSLGIKDANIEISDICTSCDKNYWSFRRDGEKCGRMLNIIGLTDSSTWKEPIRSPSRCLKAEVL